MFHSSLIVLLLLLLLFVLILFSGNRQIPGLATGAVWQNLFLTLN